MSIVLQPKMTLAEYMAWEEQQPGRNEFCRGDIYVMTGVRMENAIVTANLARHVGNHLSGTPRRVFIEAMKVQIADDMVLYPDVFVACGPFKPGVLVVTDPVLIVEVLSPSTQAYDRSQKFALYRRLPALQEYALIDPETRRVEVSRSNDDGYWNLIDMSDDAAVHLESIQCRIEMADLFDGVSAGA